MAPADVHHPDGIDHRECGAASEADGEQQHKKWNRRPRGLVSYIELRKMFQTGGEAPAIGRIVLVRVKAGAMVSQWAAA
jgi:hypothetical protein